MSSTRDTKNIPKTKKKKKVRSYDLCVADVLMMRSFTEIVNGKRVLLVSNVKGKLQRKSKVSFFSSPLRFVYLCGDSTSSFCLAIAFSCPPDTLTV